MHKNEKRYYLLLLILIGGLGACKKQVNTLAIDNLYRFSETMIVDGLERTYTLNLPPKYYDSANFSLVVALHGGGGNALQFESTCKLTEKANAAQFIVVYPEGVKSNGLLKARTWNAGACCDYAVTENINDVKFIGLLIDQLVLKYKINPKKVYATGHSNGGMLAYRLACELTNKIAAIAPNSCTMVTSICNPARSVAILHMHSILDTNVPYQGGTGSGPGTQGLFFLPVATVLNTWSLKNNCTNIAQVAINNSNYKLTKWNSCNGNVAIEYYLTQDGGHAWPGGLPGSGNGDLPSTSINANNLIWAFFQQYQLP